MAGGIAGLAGIAEKSAGEALAFGLGFALGRALEPAGVALSQEAWKVEPLRAVDAGTAAEIVAEDVASAEWGAAEAAQHGINGERFDKIVGEVLNAPGLGELFESYRRNLVTDAQFEHGLRKAKLEPMWDAPLKALKQRLLSPDQLASARQQGFIDEARQLQESALQGIDAGRAQILFDVVGLPPGAAEAMQAVNRGLADDALFAQMIREGHTKTKYTDLLLKMRRRLLTPTEYQEAALRGVLSNAEADAGAALSGMEPTDSKTLFDLMGRPLAVHQITTGLARGGTFGGSYDTVPEPYQDAIRRSSIRPEYAHLAYANRYTYPSAFVLRSLAQTGALTEAETHQTLLDIGWPPDFAAKVSAAWFTGTGGKADPHVAKASTHLWTAVHKAYVDGETTATEATDDLSALGVAAPAQPAVLALWDHERSVVRRSLTPAQIKKAYKETTFTRDEAVARLERLGMNPTDAGTLLDE